MYVLSLVAGVAQGIPAVVFMLVHSWVHILMGALTLVSTFITGALVAPVGAIAFCLFYIDERVRREGFDVEVLLNRAAGGHAFAAAEPPPQSLPSPFRRSELF